MPVVSGFEDACFLSWHPDLKGVVTLHITYISTCHTLIYSNARVDESVTSTTWSQFSVLFHLVFLNDSNGLVHDL